MAEFERILHLGLGRAILHLQSHGSAPDRDVILHACTQNISYSPVSEGTKAEYIYDIVHLTGEVSFYREQILNSLATSEPFGWDSEHLFNLAELFAVRGDKQAHQAMHRKVVHGIDSLNSGFATPILSSPA